MRIAKLVLKVTLPILVLAASVAAAAKIVANAPPPKPREVEETFPVVRARTVSTGPAEVRVPAYGTVRPMTEIEIVPRVAGRLVGLSDNLREGGFFAKDEILLRIERRDYELAVTEARAAIESARARLIREQAEAEVARAEWKKYGKGEPGALVTREPQLAEAKAALLAAESRLEAAELALSRTEIRAPFAGRVVSESVDIGQFVTAGRPVAAVYGTDAVEVRLAVPARDLPRLSLPLGPGESGPVVRLFADTADGEAEWEGEVVRTGASVDGRSRVVHAIVRVPEPYRKGRAPLLPGTFVRAEIPGRPVPDAVPVPRAALVGGDRVLLVTDEERIRIVPVTVLRAEGESMLVTGGIRDGDRVLVTPLDPVVDGMRVTVEEILR